MNDAVVDLDAGGMELNLWLSRTGIERKLGYHWVELGMISASNIMGRPYLTRQQINQFWSRVRTGEFAKALVEKGRRCDTCEGVVEADAGGMELDLWLNKIGRHHSTGYRWAELGMISTTNVMGRLYVTRQAINQFWTRADDGEFAKLPAGACKPGPKT